MFGAELYPHLFPKAAALLRSIAQNQGWKLMIDLAERKLDVDDVAEVLATHAAPRDNPG